MPEPTGQDAILYVQLLNSTQTEAQVVARSWVFSKFKAKNYEDLDQQHPVGSSERAQLTTVMAFFESVGVLVSRGLLSEDVYFDGPLGFEYLWPLVKPLIPGWQKAGGSEATWENVQWLGQRYEVWLKESWKPKLEAIPPDKPPEKQEPHVRGFQH
ncbi:MAG: hypothetical protein WAT58_06075 [Candidatus Dormiibacterota bacterium]